jgi:phosphatidylglycerophosphatase A
VKPSNPDHSKSFKRWIITMGGAGFLPAPGTWGSAVTCVILWPILEAVGANSIAQAIVACAGMVIFSALDIWLGNWGIAYFGREDPGGFVLDEAAGICLTILFLPATTGWHLARTLFVAFLAFRVFDITKPPPARQLENLPAGWGILLDDLAAAVYANLVCQFVFRYLIFHVG